MAELALKMGLMLLVVSALCGESLAGAVQDTQELSPAKKQLLEQMKAESQRMSKLFKQEEFARAAKIGESIRTIRRAILGRLHADYASTVNDLAFVYEKLNDYKTAEALYLEYKEYTEKVLGKNHNEYVLCLNNLTIVCKHLQAYKRAEIHYREMLKTLRSTVGESHEHYLVTSGNLAKLLVKDRRLSDAITVYKTELSIREKNFGKENTGYVTCLKRLARAYRSNQQFEAAKPLYLEVVKLQKIIHGETHREYLSSLNGLGLLYEDLRDFENAAEVYRKTKSLSELAFGNDDLTHATALNNLAMLHFKKEEFELAESLQKQAMRIQEKLFGSEHQDYALSLNNLGAIYFKKGQYQKAEPFYRQSKRIREKSLGKQHPDYAQSVNNLAALYLKMGDLLKAETAFVESKSIWEKIHGQDHPSYARSINSLATVYQRMQEEAKAEPLYLQAVEIRKRTLGTNHPLYVQSLTGLAINYQRRGNYDLARKLFEEALELREKIRGKAHPEYVMAQFNFGVFLLNMGEFPLAEKWLANAASSFVSVLGDSHPDYSILLAHHATSLVAQDRVSDAAKVFNHQRKVDHSTVSQFLPSLPEERQKTFLGFQFRTYLAAALSFAANHIEHSSVRQISAEWVLNSKGISHEVLANQKLVARDLNNPTVVKQVEELQHLRKQLAELVFHKPTVPESRNSHQTMISKLRNKEQLLSEAIAESTGENQSTSPWLELASLQQSLSTDSVLIEIVRFNEFDFTAIKNQPIWKASRYVAWLISHNDVKVVDLGSAEKVDDAIKKVLPSLVDSNYVSHAVRNDGEAIALKELKLNFRKLSEVVWSPIAKQLPSKTKKLIISPDGQLWLIPWSALPIKDVDDKPRFLLEKYTTRLVVSGRELTERKSQKNKSQGLSYIFADPDYDLGSDENKKSIPDVSSDLGISDGNAAKNDPPQKMLGRVERLPNTRLEAQSVSPSLEKLSGGKPKLILGESALESVLKNVEKPRYLMLSTHGFFRPDTTANQSSLPSHLDAHVSLRKKDPFDNPLLRCGLLFAGCNTSNAVGGDDGIFTGMEVVGLDLRDTEMVVLSACETGIGEVNNGEGVAGLRQAFQLAGAQSVVATLWSVPDRDSAIIMSDFFKNLANGQTRSEALRQAQLTRIKARRARHGAAHPFFWAAFTLTGQD